jgi:RimJ/RimL family protein N-acetyltransferase
MTILKTKRLILRQWRKEDLKPFSQLNADPKVMEFFPSVLSEEESAATLNAAYIHIEKYGWGKWAAELIETGELIGRIGLEEVDFPSHFSPNIELGYRLAFRHWGKGYALEGAKAAVEYGFKHLHLDEIVAFTPVQNLRSQLVMKKIGMHHDPKDDFDHPKLPDGHSLKRHVLYRINHSEWRGQ